MIRDMPCLKESNKAYEGCLLGKQHRLMELVYNDMCGPMTTSSLNNNRYFILFIDDFSRMTWVYFLKEKSKVLEYSRSLKPLSRNKVGNI
ncbi:hypothetical protein CR513_47279, partial [Mucuna pruriens]